MKVGIKDVLAALDADQEKYFPAGLDAELKIVKKIWRPYSRVFRIESCSQNIPSYFWVKMFKVPRGFQKKADKYLGRLQTEYDITMRLQDVFADIPKIDVIAPLAFFRKYGAVVTWESKGVPLSDLIDKYARLWSNHKHDDALFDYVFKCGKALAHMQDYTMQDELYDPAELIDYMDIRLQRLVKNKKAPFTKADRAQVLRFVEREITQINPEELRICGVHSDFATFNVLAEDGHITLTDFTSYKTGSPYVDLTYFYQRLGGFLHKPVFRENFIHQLQKAFLTGYGISGIEQHRMFTLSLLRHTINNFSSLVRNRRGGIGKMPMPHVQLFNRRIFRIYSEWIQEVCA
ncbi:MAG: hypothetical protein DWQ10_04560 [Calditrichaeota bacterium]|nr:MAG: hypothetical protein DWQ10_04560 [Calditrichota bacterium]